MRQAFVADLANPNFPIHRFAKNVPHGFKGLDLLEMLYGKDVPVDRAAWFIQVLGAHEVVCQAIRRLEAFAELISRRA
jgi:mediator of RNA polymerase II transcription subunit 12, fungi type